MEDIDRTFERLKRLDYDRLISLMNSPIMNTYPFEIEYPRYCESTCINNGWTLKELNDEMFRRHYDPK
jgi:hypothetical protein